MAPRTLLEARAWYENSDLSFWNFTKELEQFAAKMKRVIARGDRGPEAVTFADLLLRAIELWKAGCIEEQTGWSVANQPEEIWDAFRDALACMEAGDDAKALLAIMRLKGFGSSVDEDSRQQRAKRASVVLRMFNPKDWGVVDWRTAAMTWALNEKNWDVPQALVLMKADSPTRKKAKDEWDEIDEKIAADVLNARYRANRSDSLPDAADVEMAVFGLSFEVWTVNTKIRDTVRETYGKALRSKLQALDKQL
ncbi:MAG TPA: hypothetical protein VE957_19090 [Terriglobales bacterium]|nr:hypothetical protein [Terriglobales bacterium]